MHGNAEQNLPRIAVIAGGPGPEHVASIESALGVLEHSAALKNEFQLIVCVINREEIWLDATTSQHYLDAYSSEGLENLHQLDELARTSTHVTTPWEVMLNTDAVFPIIYGTLGEDDVLLGLCRVFTKAYIGCGILSRAICLDKTVCNAVLKHAGIPQTPHIAVFPAENGSMAAEKLNRHGLRLPWIVKPADGGCSIGVSTVRDPVELPNAFAKSREQYPDSVTVVETAVEHMIDLDVAVLEQPGDADLLVTPCGLRRRCYLGIDDICPTPVDKALLPETFGPSPQPRDTHQHGSVPDWAVPAPGIPQTAVQQMQELAKCVFQAVRASTWLRVDFFLVPSTDQIFVNEMNTMPSLASEAMLFKLWAAAGVQPSELVRQVIRYGLHRRTV